MFNDKYGLTKAVLEGRKTQTRRFLTVDMVNRTDLKCLLEKNFKCCLDKDDNYVDIRRMGNYQVGEVVAIAQAYKDCKRFVCLQELAGFNNKMFVKAELMPHHIRITDVRIERLQDISDEDCIAEGITQGIRRFNNGETVFYKFENKDNPFVFSKAREAYAALIDKISGKATWNANPFVFVYGFELIK